MAIAKYGLRDEGHLRKGAFKILALSKKAWKTGELVTKVFFMIMDVQLLTDDTVYIVACNNWTKIGHV